MDVFSNDSRMLLKNGRPFLPMMGEFHYARYPRSEWRVELRKMKALGVSIVATYVFWIHHEENEGVFDFSGDKALSDFLAVCGEEGLYAFVRMGPWCHGEARYGGFPKWLMEKDIVHRSNDPEYLRYVRRFWEQAAEQVKPHLLQNGGCVIGIQLENEYGHCGGTGEYAHMQKLYEMARELGLVVPYYTATGWGGAQIGPALPVMGGYCDAPWDRTMGPLPPSECYVFSDERNDQNIGSDFEKGRALTFDPSKYPFLLAEMGGGIYPFFHRRPVAGMDDVCAMTVVKLGSGANMIGYYMFHGGTNPGEESNETRETGSYCECATKSYAPHVVIGENGQISDLARGVKCIAMFLKDFGEMLAPLPVIIPDGTAVRPDDTEHPRIALRIQDGHGFAFVNNYQRSLSLPERDVEVPQLGKVHMQPNAYKILPIRLPVGNAFVSSTNAQPLCKADEKTWLFICDEEPVFTVEGDLNGCVLKTVSRREALDLWRTKDGLVCVPNAMVLEDGTVFRTDEQARCVPYERKFVNYQCYTYILRPEYRADSFDELLRIEYEGSIAEIYANGEKLTDDYYDGSGWEIALKRYNCPKEIELRVYALFEGMPVWLEHPPKYEDGRALRLHSVTMRSVHAGSTLE